MAEPTDGQSIHARLWQPMGRRYDEGRHTNATITCGERSWAVNTMALSSHSDFFDKIFDGQFKEAQDLSADLSENNPDAVDQLLYFCHHIRYEPEKGPNTGDLDLLVLHIELYAVADKYFISSLCDLVIERLREQAHVKWDQQEFADAITSAYTLADYPKIRQCLVEVAFQHYHEYVGDKERFQGFRAASNEVPGFATDLLHAMGPLVRALRPLPPSAYCRCGKPFRLHEVQLPFIHNCEGVGRQQQQQIYFDEVTWIRHSIDLLGLE